MNSLLARVAFVWLLCGLTACSAPTEQRFDSEFLAMGTQIQLTVLAEDPAITAGLSAQIERDLLRQGIDWYPWTTDASGELKRLNAALASGDTFTSSPGLLTLLQQTQRMFAASDGYFDPAVAPLTRYWGLAELESAASKAPLDSAVLTRWRANRPTLRDLRINGQQISSARHDLQLDLGAIAKGYAAQQALQRLHSLGCDEAAINMGGQIAVMGSNMAQQLAAVAIRDPRAARGLATLQLKAGESISTSGDYERFVERDGKRLHHLFDPHTGSPVAHTQAVTVVSSDATLADAASTALMAAGPDNWQRIARQLGVREVLRIDATGAIEVTAALYARLHWLPATQARVIRQIAL
jgi:FAD:protein FMN transferase